MLGHKMFQASFVAFADTWCTLHGKIGDYPVRGIDAFRSRQIVEDCEAMDLDAIDSLLDRLRPSVVINCVGIIKHRPAASESIASITLNSLLPHRLAQTLSSWQGRLIHISTDCVFDGIRGSYTEEDATNAVDLYGRSKALGETVRSNSLTLRTSIIGRELRSHNSLLDWFLSQNHGSVAGYRRALWSGVTTNHLADLIVSLIALGPTLSGLYHVSSGNTSKFELLHLIKTAYKLDVEIRPDENYVLDRTLSGRKLEAAMAYRCPPLDHLIREMAGDPTEYQPTSINQ